MLVTAIMPTARDPSRRDLTSVAIDCFLGQTFTDAELLIVNHSGESFRLGHPRVREVMVSRPPTLGDLRNLGLDAATGKLTITWDDDDWHAPERMETQVAAWERTGKAVVLGYYTVCDLRSGHAFVESCHNYPCGGCCSTILLPPSGIRYPAWERGEDSDVANTLRRQGRLHVVENEDNPLLYVRTSHGTNTCPTEFIMRPSRAFRQLTAAETNHLHRVLDQYRVAEYGPRLTQQPF